MKETIFYNGFNLLVDLIIFSLTAFFFYRSGIQRGFFEGMEAEALSQEYTRKHADADLDKHWEGAIK
jgi:hypothetical protein